MSYIEIELTPLILTKKAALCDTGEDEPVWIPFSQFETPPDADDRNVSSVFEISEWFCMQEGLI